MPAMATKKKPTEPTTTESSEQASADTEPAPDTPAQQQAFIETAVANLLDQSGKVDQAEGRIVQVPESVVAAAGIPMVTSTTTIDAPHDVEPGEALERRSAIQLLQEAIAAVYGADVAANYIAARRDDLAAISVPEILDAAANVPPVDSPEAEHIRDAVMADAVVLGAPTVAGDLPSGVPAMLPPEEVRNALRPPALQVTVPEQGFEVRPRDDAPSYYRVMVGQTLMVDGLMATFRRGQVIDDRNYDLGWLRKQGVEVVPCEAPEPYSSPL